MSEFEMQIPEEFKYLYEPQYNSIVKVPSEKLRVKCDNVIVFTEKTKQFVNKLIKEMKNCGGVGLSAPQLGKNINIIVVDDGVKPFELINPHITAYGGPIIESEEGCLSIPGLYGLVHRVDKIGLVAMDRNGKSFQSVLEGLTARIVQHEMDHLSGILFIDKAATASLNWKHPS